MNKAFTLLDKISSKKSMLERKSYLTGFTLIEILISLVIVLLLVIFLTVSYNSAKVNGKCARIKQDFDAIAKAARLHFETTGAWAADANTGVAPAFVPEYLTQWPSGEFYQNDGDFQGTPYDAKYDWEAWPNGTAYPRPIMAISLRAAQKIKAQNNWDEEYFYCVADNQANPNNCLDSTRNPLPPTPLNAGGTCP